MRFLSQNFEALSEFIDARYAIVTDFYSSSVCENVGDTVSEERRRDDVEMRLHLATQKWDEGAVRYIGLLVTRKRRIHLQIRISRCNLRKKTPSLAAAHSWSARVTDF